MGPGPGHDESIRIPNRCVEWRRNCIAYKADPHHAKIAIRMLGLEGAKSMATPGVKHKVVPEDDDPLLNSGQSTLYRSVAARYNFSAQDRVDIQYVTKRS